MADISSKVKALINSVRGTMKGMKEGGMQADGYRQYRREKEVMGEPVMPYEQWRAQAPKLSDKQL